MAKQSIVIIPFSGNLQKVIEGNRSLSFRIREFATKVLWREVAVEKKSALIQEQERIIASAQTLIIPHPEKAINPQSAQEENTRLEARIAQAQAQIVTINTSCAELLKTPEYKFKPTKADSAFLKAWRESENPADRILALSDWFRANGIDTNAKEVASLEYFLESADTSSKRVEGVVMDGCSFTGIKNLTLRGFYTVILDLYIQKGVFKLDMVPAMLRPLYEAKRAAAKAEKEAKQKARKESHKK